MRATVSASVLVVAGRRHRRLADVEVEVEVGVLDPVRVVEAERHLGELPAERRQHVDALADQPADVLAAQRAAGRGRRVVDRQAATRARTSARPPSPGTARPDSSAAASSDPSPRRPHAEKRPPYGVRGHADLARANRWRASTREALHPLLRTRRDSRDGQARNGTRVAEKDAFGSDRAMTARRDGVGRDACRGDPGGSRRRRRRARARRRRRAGSDAGRAARAGVLRGRSSRSSSCSRSSARSRCDRRAARRRRGAVGRATSSRTRRRPARRGRARRHAAGRPAARSRCSCAGTSSRRCAGSSSAATAGASGCCASRRTASTRRSSPPSAGCATSSTASPARPWCCRTRRRRALGVRATFAWIGGQRVRAAAARRARRPRDELARAELPRAARRRRPAVVGVPGQRDRLHRRPRRPRRPPDRLLTAAAPAAASAPPADRGGDRPQALVEHQLDRARLRLVVERPVRPAVARAARRGSRAGCGSIGQSVCCASTFVRAR